MIKKLKKQSINKLVIREYLCSNFTVNLFHDKIKTFVDSRIALRNTLD